MVALCLATSEGMLRVIGYQKQVATVPDALTGYFHAPNLEFDYRDEGHGRVVINSQGLRDREHDFTKPPGVYRIAILGDSYAEALQVDAAETFWSILERKLASCAHTAAPRPVEVINFGMTSFGTDQELLTLRHRVWQYDPDLVLLAFLPANDVRNNSSELEPVNLKPFFHLDSSGQLVLDDSFLNSPKYLQSTSRFVTMARDASRRLRVLQLLSRVKFVIERRRAEASSRAGTVAVEQGLDDWIYSPIETLGPAQRRAWDVTEQLLRQVALEVRERGRALLVVTLSSGVQVDPDDDRREGFRRALGVPDLFYPNRRIAEFGSRYGFPVLGLAEPMLRIARERGVHLHGFGDALGSGHWNESGHEVAGELIAEHVCEQAPRYGLRP